MTDDELGKYSEQLSDILEYASMLNELDIEGVEPTMHAVPIKNVFREDEVRESLDIEKVLKSAPESEGNYFRVPRIIDESEGH